MPLVSPKPKPSDSLKFFKSKAILASLICSIVLVGGIFWHLHHKTTPITTAAVGTRAVPTPSVAACSAPDQSFCATQTTFSQYVANGDFSDILQHQVTNRVTCGTAAAPAAACAGIGNGLTIELFSLTQAGVSSYVTRNTYIDFMHQYASQYGPFQFTGDSASPNAITMMFAGSNGSKTLHLNFQSVSGAWKLESIAVS